MSDDPDAVHVHVRKALGELADGRKFNDARELKQLFLAAKIIVQKGQIKAGFFGNIPGTGRCIPFF